MGNSIINISDWQSGSQYSVPIGKRIKSVVYNQANGKHYYFKVPKEKYPWEFWSEIISYEIGQYFGFNVLEYAPAIYNEQMGCLSESMINENEELVHGQQYLTQLLKSFDTKKGRDHNFQLIEEFFQRNEKLADLMDDFISMLIFDSVIGNRDRHQQNWAIIRSLSIEFDRFILNARLFNKNITLPKLIWKLIISNFSKKKQHEIGEISLSVKEDFRFAPFFDNGNSLAYNILEENIPGFLSQRSKIDNYLFGSKAICHIKWNGVEIRHIDLLENIKQNYNAQIIRGIQQISEKYNELELERLVNDIESPIGKYSLSSERKELIFILLKERINRLLSKF